MSRPTNIVAVDLGKRVCGLAWFVGGNLAGCCEVRVRSGAPSTMAGRLVSTAPPDLRDVPWFAEWMLDYTGKGGRRSRLDALRRVAEQIERRGINLTMRPAWAWKGGISKPITRCRVLGALERDDYEPQLHEITKETIDAIGLGLFELDRVGRGVVKPNRSAR